MAKKTTGGGTATANRSRKRFTKVDLCAEIVRRLNEDQPKDEILNEVAEKFDISPDTAYQNYQRYRKEFKDKDGIELPGFPSSRGTERGDVDELKALLASQMGGE